MPYLDIVFHNVRAGGTGRTDGAGSRAYYTGFPTDVNVCQTWVGGMLTSGPTAVGGLYASQGWGDNITGAAAPGWACGMFFCESSPYPYWPDTHYNPNWLLPFPPAAVGFPPVAVISAVPIGPTALPGQPPPYPHTVPPDSIRNSFTPAVSVNHLCAFMEGIPDAAPPGGAPALAPASPNWLLKSNPNCALQCIGTGDNNFPLYGPGAPSGSDRYALYFQATDRTYDVLGTAITGVFVHVKNTFADAGTQIAALCRRFPDSIIFGDLNFDIRIALKLQSLNATINGTHTVLAIQQPGGDYYYTHLNMLGWISCLDYALVPNAYVQHVELWAYRPGAAATLYPNGSDHSVMMLRVHCG